MGNETSSISKSKDLKSANTNKEGPKTAQIVTVKEKPIHFSKTEEQETASRLGNCLKFEPLVPSLSSRADNRPLSNELIHKFSEEPAYRLSLNLQKHIQSSSKSVKLQQSSICNQIKEVDKVGLFVTQKLVDRQRKFSQIAIASKQVDDISLSLERIETSLQKAFQLADQLNMILPDKDRIKEDELQ